MSLMNGLSAAGSGLASFAASTGIEAQRADAATALQASGGVIAATAAQKLAGTQSDLMTQKAGLEQQQAILADQLATTRESGGRVQAGSIAAAAAEKDQAFRSAEAEKSRGVTISEGAATREAEQKRVETTTNAKPPEARLAEWWAGATPEQRSGLIQYEGAKQGLPAWMMDTDPTPPTTQTPVTTQPATGSTVTGVPASGDTGAETSTDTSGAASTITKPTGVPGLSLSPAQQVALQRIPVDGRPIVRNIILGLEPAPTGRVAASQYGRNIMSLVRQVEPDADETTWAGRLATRKAFGPDGQAGKVVASVNTAMGHADHLLNQFEQLGNYSLGEIVNQPLNYLAGKTGGGAVVKATTGTIEALASEARKIYAGTGGGSESELNEWKKSFPINGSMAEQRASLENFVELLNGKLNSLASQYNKGMRTSIEPYQMLDPKPAATYRRLLNHEPDDSTGYQTGRPPQASGAGSTDAATATPAASTTAAAPPVAAIPAWVKPGDQYSPSRGQARGSDGKIYGPQ